MCGQTRALRWPRRKRQRPGQGYGASPRLRRLQEPQGLRAPSCIPCRTHPVWWCLGRTQWQVRASNAFSSRTQSIRVTLGILRRWLFYLLLLLLLIFLFWCEMCPWSVVDGFRDHDFEDLILCGVWMNMRLALLSEADGWDGRWCFEVCRSCWGVCERDACVCWFWFIVMRV